MFVSCVRTDICTCCCFYKTTKILGTHRCLVRGFGRRHHHPQEYQIQFEKKKRKKNIKYKQNTRK